MEKVEKRTDRIKMDVILAAGCMLRLFYVLFSTIYDRQYDIGMIDLDAGHTAVKRAISQMLFVLLLAFCLLSTAMTAVWCLL